MKLLQTSNRQSGFSMIEVLVTLVILLLGLLGLAGLMAQGQRSEVESYQRVQALIVVQDMVGRINANRNVARCYGAITASPASGTNYVGTGATSPVPPPTSGAGSCTIGTTNQQNQFIADVTAWNALLLGTAEDTGLGGMIGARGCVSYDVSSEWPQINPVSGLATGNTVPNTGIYTVSVAWQGMGDSGPSPLQCATGQYGSPPGAADTKRRAVSMTFRIANLN